MKAPREAAPPTGYDTEDRERNAEVTERIFAHRKAHFSDGHVFCRVQLLDANGVGAAASILEKLTDEYYVD